MACDHYKYWKLQIHRGKWNMSHLSNVIKGTCIVNLQKKGKTDNHWVGQSVMKPVDAESFKRRKYTKEVGGEKHNNFDMEILDEGALEKALKV